MKGEVLRLLSSENGYVSGQEICEKLSVSRTAVWKAINQLREEGYVISSVNNRGYRIDGRPDVITAEEIKSRLKTSWAGQDVRFYERIDSTNNEAKRLAETSDDNKRAGHGTLVVAEEQTLGKGRRGRSWVTPKKSAIAMSLILRPDFAPSRASMLTLVMGLSVACALRDAFGVDVGIKWPNDVVAEGKKVCGILTEMSCESDYIGYVVIGVGINTHVTDFPPELSDVAVSLHTLSGKLPDRAALIDTCMEKFEFYYERFLKTQDLSLLMKEYNNLLSGKEDRIRVLSSGEEFTGISYGINEAGELLVERPGGEVEHINAGEVSVRGIYGYQ